MNNSPSLDFIIHKSTLHYKTCLQAHFGAAYPKYCNTFDNP